jgi:hypothetical protein
VSSGYAMLRFAGACSVTTAASDIIPEGAPDTNAAFEAMIVKPRANDILRWGVALRLRSPARETTSATVTMAVPLLWAEWISVKRCLLGQKTFGSQVRRTWSLALLSLPLRAV